MSISAMDVFRVETSRQHQASASSDIERIQWIATALVTEILNYPIMNTDTSIKELTQIGQWATASESVKSAASVSRSTASGPKVGSRSNQSSSTSNYEVLIFHRRAKGGRMVV